MREELAELFAVVIDSMQTLHPGNTFETIAEASQSVSNAFSNFEKRTTGTTVESKAPGKSLTLADLHGVIRYYGLDKIAERK